jgi:NitT/TauT family transport system substrate-binding protein
MKNNLGHLLIYAVMIAVPLLVWNTNRNSDVEDTAENVSQVREKVVINEAVRTLLYLPLYHAEHRGFFRELDLDVEIITSGSATAAFASMLSGEADFAQADPMYVPISREKGSDALVLAQVIARISLWGVAGKDFKGEFTQDNVRGKTIASHPRPMTGYTYAVKAIKEIGLDPERDVRLLEVRPGGELAALFSGEADIAFTLEPGTSIAEGQGSKVLVSFPEKLGDQVFTALMTSASKIKQRPDVVKKVAMAFQKSLTEITSDPNLAAETAKVYFSELDADVLAAVLKRLVDEKVYPISIRIPETSWNKAISERVAIGDLKSAYPYEMAQAEDIINQVAP